MHYLHFFQFDSSIENGVSDPLWQDSVTVESGVSVFAPSNNGSAFEVGSAVLDLGQDRTTFGIGGAFGINLHMKMVNGATDGIIVACDDIERSRPVWALELVGADSSAFVRLLTFDAKTKNSSEARISVPADSDYHNYSWQSDLTFVYTSLDGETRVNRGYNKSGIAYNASTTENDWFDSAHNFEFRIGRSLYATNPPLNASNPFAKDSVSATGVYLDWYLLSPENEGYGTSANLDSATLRVLQVTNNSIAPPSSLTILCNESNDSASADTSSNCVLVDVAPIVVTTEAIQKEDWA